MSNATVSRVGQVNGAGDVDALFLKVFAGEVLTAFAEKNVMMDKHMVRTIANGKSAQFPVTGNFSAAYHTPGAEILGTAMNHAERVITIDDLLIAHTFIANIDEAKNHYDVRANYSRKLGEALANTADKHLFQNAILAARASATVTGGNGGSRITNANMGTDSDVLIAALFEAAQKFDEKDVPEDERYVFLKPAQYYKLAQNTKVLNKDWGGSGVYSDGKVFRIAGMTVVASNHIPTTNITTGVDAGTSARYAVDARTTIGVALQKEAIGTVKLLDLAMESEYDIRRQGTLMVAKYAMGHGILRPECAIELATGAVA
jgi:Phage capsid protein